MKKRLLFIPLLLFCIGIQADDTESVKKQINSIKKDSQYIYADVTAGSVEDAKRISMNGRLIKKSLARMWRRMPIRKSGLPS